MISNEEGVDGSIRFLSEEIEKYLENTAINEVQYYEKESKLILSALAKDYYYLIDRNGGDFWADKLYWKHPLINDLKDFIDII